MLIANGKQFLQTPFDNEEELENVVVQNADYIFGPGSIYLPKRLIHTLDGYGTIPDGFAIDIPNRKWFVVEAVIETQRLESYCPSSCQADCCGSSYHNKATSHRTRCLGGSR
ncbi:MAG: hypothetical protein U9Q92_02770 [archaeon]|nr:hypothetical protein [archaeon]